MKSLAVFIGGALLFGAAALGVGFWLGGDAALLQGSAAFALAFTPAAITLAWVTFSYRSAPDMRLFASLGASGIRMAIALGGGYFLVNQSPNFDMTFWYWLILFYLVFLAFEITILVRQQPNLNGPPPA